MKQKAYQSYIRNHWPLPFCEPWLYGPTKLARKPFKYNFILCTRLNDKSGWHYFSEDLFKLGHIIDKYLAQPKHLSKFVAEARTAREENYRFSKRIEKLDVENLNLKQLGLLLREWYMTHSRFCAAFMPIDATDETLENDIRNSLLKAKINLSFSELACLLTPDAESYVQKGHKDFCDVLKGKLSAEEYVGKWWWTPMGWSQYQPLTIEKVGEEIKKIKDINAYIEKQKQEGRKRAELLRQKKEIMKRLPKDVLDLLAVFEVLAAMHDIRKEIQIRMMQSSFNITEAILKKNSIPVHFRDYFVIKEYLDLAKGVKIPYDVLESRKKAFWCQAVAGGKISMFSGKKALEKLEKSKIYEQTAQEQKAIKGIPASPGRAEGVVRVSLDSKVLIKNFKNGEILVTSMTTPDFVPAMKKAVAIITDDGGITCHAAIISRELKIPCIIGTKIATKVLKDGDVVEVDADKGVIKIIK